jgi:hypothetical protein
VSVRVAHVRSPDGRDVVGPDITYLCFRCDARFASESASSAECDCGNLRFDAESGRWSFEDESRVVGIVDGSDPGAYSPGECPVGCGPLLFIVAEPTTRVLIYCPSCACTWAHPRDALDKPDSTVEDFGGRVARPADRGEVEAAGFGPLITEQFQRYWTGPDERPAALHACEAYAVAADAAWRQLEAVAQRFNESAPVCFDARRRRVVIPLPSSVVLGGEYLTAWIRPEGNAASIFHVDLPRRANETGEDYRRLRAIVEDFRAKVSGGLPRRK